MPSKPKKNTRKEIRGWALTKYDAPKELRYDPGICQFKIYTTKAIAEANSWGKGFHVIKRVSITIEP